MASAPSTEALRPSITGLGAPPENIIGELTSGVIRVVRRVELYESDGITQFDIPNWNRRLLDGSVTIDRDRDERRAADLTLENSDGALKLNPHDGFWYDKIIKVFWGIRYIDPTEIGLGWSRWELQIGEFMIDRVDESRFPNAIKVTGRDYTKKCLTSKLAYSMTFPTGMPVEEIIKNLALNAGITKFALPTTGQNYNRDLVFTRGTERWKVMQELADVIGYEVYFRGDGALTMRPYPDPSTDPLTWSFNYGGGGSLVDYTRSSDDSRIFNHVMVTGQAQSSGGSEYTGEQDTTGTIIFAEVKNDVPGSPTNIERMGDRVLVYESDLFATNEAALQYARTMLRIASLEEFTMAFQSLILPWLEPSDIVEIIEDEVSASQYTPIRFLLTNMTIPLRLGPMSGTAKRVTIVGTENGLDFE